MDPPDRVPVVRIGGRSREPLLLIGMIGLGIAVAFLKPWGPGVATPPVRASQAAEPAPIAELPSAAIPTVAARANSACDYGAAWRLLTIGQNAERLVETWYSAEPVHAEGPTDATIPVVRMFTDGLRELGYCAVTQPVGPRPVLAVEAWRLVPGDPPVPIPLVRTSRYAPADPDVGALYAAPVSLGGTTAAVWPPGHYVLVVRYGPQPLEADWFSVAVVQSSRSPVVIP
jgi:hypothetical protein